VVGRSCFEHFPDGQRRDASAGIPTQSFLAVRDHKADEDVDVLHLIDDAALGSRMGWCGSRARCAPSCPCARQVPELKDDVCASAEEAREASGEAGPGRDCHLGKQAYPVQW
jgi:hypothetical protein